jgi:hypothetical protein
MKKEKRPSRSGFAHKRIFPLTIILVALGGLVYLFRAGKLKDFLKNQYLVAAGMMGTLAAIIFFLFRFIRFLVRLYP